MIREYPTIPRGKKEDFIFSHKLKVALINNSFFFWHFLNNHNIILLKILIMESYISWFLNAGLIKIRLVLGFRFLIIDLFY